MQTFNARRAAALYLLEAGRLESMTRSVWSECVRILREACEAMMRHGVRCSHTLDARLIDAYNRTHLVPVPWGGVVCCVRPFTYHMYRRCRGAPCDLLCCLLCNGDHVLFRALARVVWTPAIDGGHEK